MSDMHTPLLPELLPCPHCGSIHVTDRHVRDGRQMFCVNCGASVAPTYHGPNGDTLQRAIATWNARTPSQDAETIKAMREALAGLIVQWDAFEASYGNQEEAYYKLAKYARPAWDAARAALAGRA